MRSKIVGSKLLSLVAGTALALTACGGGTGSTGSKDEEPVAKSSPGTDLSAELTWWDTSDPTNEGPAFDELIAQFEKKYPKVDVKREAVPFGETQNKFKTAAAAKSGAPDILRAEVAWVPEFASLGYLYALDGTPLAGQDSDFLEAAIGSTKFEGKTYGVPQVTDSLALLYNKKLLEKAGVAEAPKTWDDLETAAKAIEKKTGAKGVFVNAGGYFVLPFIYGEGGDLLDTEAKKITVNEDAAVKGFARAQQLVKSGAAVKPPAQDSYGTMMTLFKEGKVAMIVNGPWEVNNIKSAPEFGGLDNLGIAPVPAGSQRAGAPVGGHDYVIYSGMPQEKAQAAVAFVEFMSSAESQAFLADKLGLLPTRVSAYDQPQVKSNPVVSAFQPVMEVAVPRAWIPEGGQVFGPLDEAATKVLVQNGDPKKALDTVAKKYKAEVVKDYAAQ